MRVCKKLENAFKIKSKKNLSSIKADTIDANDLD